MRVLLLALLLPFPAWAGCITYTDQYGLKQQVCERPSDAFKPLEKDYYPQPARPNAHDRWQERDRQQDDPFRLERKRQKRQPTYFN